MRLSKRFFTPFLRLFFLIGILFTTVGSIHGLEIFLNRPFTSNESPTATIYASGEGPLFLRLYRVDDVKGYLTQQSNVHTVTENNKRVMQPGYFLWRSVVENIEHSLYSLARRYMRADYRERLREALGLHKYAFPFRDRFPETNLFSPLKLPLVSEKTLQVHARYWQALKHNFGKLANGYYVVEVSQGRRIAHSPLVVSDIAMVTKTSPENILVYAIDLKTGEPLDDASVTALTGKKNKHEESLTFSLSDGIAFTDDTGFLNGAEKTVYVLKRGSDYAFTDLYALDAAKKLFEAAVYTDRPLYRMGDKVQVRGVFVRRQGAAAHGKVAYSVKNPQNEVVFSGAGQLSSAGSLAFEFATNNLKPAYYRIEMILENETHSGSFLIEQYKKPETRASFRSEKNVVLSGETAEVFLSAAYYSGEALAQTPATITIERSALSYPWWYGFGSDEYYGYDYSPYQWETVKEFNATLDAQGHLKITVPTDEQAEFDYTYRVRASVSAKNREETQAATRFKVYRSKVNLRLSQDRWYFNAQDAITFQVATSDIYTEKPVAASLKAELFLREYLPKEKKYKDVLVSTLDIETKSDGAVSAELPSTKKAGVYFLRVTARDGSRITRQSLETYVYDAGDYYAGESGDIQRTVTVTADKKQYSLFDTAHFAVRLPTKKKLAVLVTLENDRIRKHKLLRNQDASFTYDEELKSSLSPNFELRIAALEFDKYPRYYEGSTEVILPPKDRVLQVEVIADRARYRPGEEANFLVKTKDFKGRAVSAEFSLGVVDEAIYALREDALTSLSLQMNPRLSNRVVTSDSLQFSFYGYGAEKSLYALYREQMADVAAMRKGEDRSVKIRKNFKDTAFFTAEGKTEKNGIAKLSVRLPDNLTEWRITAHANTSAGLTGSVKAHFTVAKDFALRLATPRFLRERDEAKLRLLISNQLKTDQKTKITPSFVGIELLRPMVQEITVRPGEERFIDFDVAARQFPKDSQATLTFVARSQEDNDGLEKKLPVLPYGVENYTSKQKIFSSDESTWQTRLSLDKDARKDLGELVVSFSPGVIPSVMESLPYLIKYPYGCVEQTLSTFLPVLWASNASKKLKVNLPVKKEQIETISTQALDKLYGYQHADGGWGWWSDDPTDIYMTAYTLYGFFEAKKAGVKIDSEVFTKGKKFLEKELQTAHLTELKDSYSIHRLLFAQFVYLQTSPQGALSQALKTEWNALLKRGFREPAGLALILEGAHLAKFEETKKTALDSLVPLAQRNEQGAYFEKTNAAYGYWFDDKEEITAQVLNALLVAESKTTPLQRELVSYLLAQKKIQRWRSTKLTSLVTRALTLFAEHTKERVGKNKVSVEVDGKRQERVVDGRHLKWGDLQMSFRTVAQQAQVKVNREGSGFFLARAEWRHYLNKPITVPRVGKFSVTRKFFKIQKQANGYAQGSQSYIFKAGDIVMSEAYLKASERSEYVLVEDYIPAGFEPLNAQELETMEKLRYNNYANQPSAVTRLDDRVALAKTYMPHAAFAPRAFYRAVFPGKYQTMPVQGGLMYYPETFAYSDIDVISIEE